MCVCAVNMSQCVCVCAVNMSQCVCVCCEYVTMCVCVHACMSESVLGGFRVKVGWGWVGIVVCE